MCDYGSSALWDEGAETTSAALGLSDSLSAEILAWQRQFETSYDDVAGWVSTSAEHEHRNSAELLGHRLAAELGPDFEVEVTVFVGGSSESVVLSA